MTQIINLTNYPTSMFDHLLPKKEGSEENRPEIRNLSSKYVPEEAVWKALETGTQQYVLNGYSQETLSQMLNAARFSRSEVF